MTFIFMNRSGEITWLEEEKIFLILLQENIYIINSEEPKCIKCSIVTRPAQVCKNGDIIQRAISTPSLQLVSRPKHSHGLCASSEQRPRDSSINNGTINPKKERGRIKVLATPYISQCGSVRE